LSATLVPIFADRESHVVSVTDPYGRILGFIDRYYIYIYIHEYIYIYKTYVYIYYY
jgi:CBS-domain-containing membrane protein